MPSWSPLTRSYICFWAVKVLQDVMQSYLTASHLNIISLCFQVDIVSNYGSGCYTRQTRMQMQFNSLLNSKAGKQNKICQPRSGRLDRYRVERWADKLTPYNNRRVVQTGWQLWKPMHSLLHSTESANNWYVLFLHTLHMLILHDDDYDWALYSLD